MRIEKIAQDMTEPKVVVTWVSDIDKEVDMDDDWGVFDIDDNIIPYFREVK